jgi:hypothetical protein
VKVEGHERDGAVVTLILSMSVLSVLAVVTVKYHLSVSFVPCHVSVLDSLSGCGVFVCLSHRHGIVGSVCLFLFCPCRLCSPISAYDHVVYQSACPYYRDAPCHLYLLIPLWSECECRI